MSIESGKAVSRIDCTRCNLALSRSVKLKSRPSAAGFVPIRRKMGRRHNVWAIEIFRSRLHIGPGHGAIRGIVRH